MEKIDLEQLLEIEKFLYDQGDKCAFINGEVVPLSQPQYLKDHYLIYEDERPQFINYITSHNISKEEAFMLSAITGRGSSWINQPLSQRKPKLDELQEKVVTYLDDILRKLEGYKETSHVYRFDRYARDCKESAKRWFENNKGQIVKIPWFLSTTQDPGWGCSDVIWQIELLPCDKTKSHDVADLHSEREIRFERNVTFKIQEIKEEESKILIALVEVDGIEDVTLHDGDYDRL